MLWRWLPRIRLFILSWCFCVYLSFFFFQAEDGIRDHCVTGVQTCALPICGQPQGRRELRFSRRRVERCGDCGYCQIGAEDCEREEMSLFSPASQMRARVAIDRKSVV